MKQGIDEQCEVEVVKLKERVAVNRGSGIFMLFEGYASLLAGPAALTVDLVIGIRTVC